MIPAFPTDRVLASLLSPSSLQILSALTDGVVVADLQGNVVWMNPAALRTHNFTELSESRRPLADIPPDFAVFSDSGVLIPPEDWPLSRIIRGETLDGWELEVRRSNPARSSFASYSGRFVLSSLGEPEAVVLTIRDCTRSKQAERDLKVLEEERLLAFEAADMGAWHRDLATGSVRLSHRARRQFGFFENKPIVLADILNAIHPEDRARVSAALDAAILGRSNYEAEYRVVHRDGSEHWITSIGRASYDADGNPYRMQGVLIDITDRRRAQQDLLAVQQQLHHSQKLESLGVLAGGVAHDFNNLLTGILGNASLVLDSFPPDDPHRVMLEEVVHAGERAAGLTRQLLAYAGKGRFVTRSIHLSELVREMHRLIRTSVPNMVHVAQHLPAGLPAIDGDPTQIQQVVINLILNAAEAIEAGKPGTVLVETLARNLVPADFAGFFNADALSAGSYVALQVHDTGSGMDETTKSRIFDPFFTTKFTGRGLGLSAVLGIVRGHKGALKVQSTPGQGTTFAVVFPAAANQPPLAEHQPGGTEMILAIGPCVRQMEGLRNLGYPVLFCETLRMAEPLLRDGEEPIAVVICSGGQENFPAAVHKHRPDVHVILSSKEHPPDQIRKYPGQRFSAYLHESADTTEIDRAIRQLL